MTKFQTQRKSFTLIEMLVVVVIIGILAGVLVPRLTGAKERASDSARIVKVWQISSAVELYAQEKGTTYPRAPLTGAPWISVATPIVTDAISPYLTNIPTDPGKWTVAISTEPGGILATGDSFAYWTNDAWTGYAITALMESKKGNTTNGTGVIDSDKQGSYQKVGKWLTTNIVPGGGTVDTSVPWVYFEWGHTIVSDGTNVYTMMDKNLWASEVGTTSASYGYYYQRGNNYGFWNGTAWTNQDWTATIATTSTLVPSPTAPYTGSTFVLAPNSPYDWATPQNPNLRLPGGQWPCPTGYHIPTSTERQWLYNARVKIYSGDAIYASNKWFLLRDTLKLPMAGRRLIASAGVYGQGSGGRYWSSTPNGASSYILGFDSSDVDPADYGYRANGFSARCFKNSP